MKCEHESGFVICPFCREIELEAAREVIKHAKNISESSVFFDNGTFESQIYIIDELRESLEKYDEVVK